MSKEDKAKWIRIGETLQTICLLIIGGVFAHILIGEGMWYHAVWALPLYILIVATVVSIPHGKVGR